MGSIAIPPHLIETAYSQFAAYLLNQADKPYTQAQIIAGLEPVIYSSLVELQTEIPIPTNADDTTAPPTEPNFAMIDDGLTPELKLAYWDFGAGAGGSWAETTFPWNFPFLQPGPVVNFPTVSGNTAWPYTMGSVYRILNAGRITEIYMTAGAGGVGLQHRWEILRSTVVSPTIPLASTFTNVVRTGIHTYAVANAWESMNLAGAGGDVVISPDEWYIAWHYLGGGGQTLSIATLRTGGQLIEDYASLESGAYALTGGPNPGTMPLPTPTNLVSTVIYGVNTLRMDAP